MLIYDHGMIECIFMHDHILGVVKRNPLFLHEIEWKNNGFLFTTPNMYIHVRFCMNHT